MEKYYLEFYKLLEDENRYGCVTFALDLLSKNKVTVPQLYEEIIKPSIENIKCKLDEKDMCIWQEHVRTSIVRTVIESCYTYVVDEAKKLNRKNKYKVVVLCPEGEYHDIGARMVSDFFVIAGFDVIFVGSDTPKSDFLAAVEYIKPDYIAISVSNYYNLVAAKKTIDSIKKKTRKNIKILAGGLAFRLNKDATKIIGADALTESYKDILKVGEV